MLPGVMLVAQNGISFDFRVLQSEFERCNVQALPHDWLLFDSLYFMRALYRGVWHTEGPCTQCIHLQASANVPRLCSSPVLERFKDPSASTRVSVSQQS